MLRGLVFLVFFLGLVKGDLLSLKPLPTEANLKSSANCTLSYQIQSGDTCFVAAQNCNITLAQLYRRNSVLENGAACTRLKVGQQINCCPNNTQGTSETDCSWWVTIGAGDTCTSVATGVCQITLPELYQLNSVLESGQACTRMAVGQQLCCSKDPSHSNDKTLEQNVKGCSFWWTVGSGDTCLNVADACKIPLSELYDKNPALDNGNGCTRLAIGQQLCCSKNGSFAITNAKSSVQTTPATNCFSSYTVQPGDACFVVADKCGITLDELYRQNSVLDSGAACNRLAIGQNLCCKNS